MGGRRPSAETASQNCHLDRRTLSICISMIENGVNPEALAVGFSFLSLYFGVLPLDGQLGRARSWLSSLYNVIFANRGA
jgi:hypothetical protein